MEKQFFRSFSIRSILLLILIGTFAMTVKTKAQCPADEIVTGLHTPLAAVLTNQGNLIVSETGTVVVHSGCISIINSTNGNRRTLISGMPSAIADVGDPAGPQGLFMRGRTLYVIIGVGDVAVPGPFPGTLIPNPNGPSSPIFSSVLAIHFSASVEKNTTGFSLTTADQQALADGETVTLSNSGQEKITIEMIANFPDYVPFPLPNFEDNIQHSNPFQLVVADNNLYVTDGGRNLLWKVDINTGAYSALASFPSIPNPVFPTFGGPFLDAVPTGIEYSDGKILVTLFRGFPFPPGVSSVQKIDPVSGSYSSFLSELRTAIGLMSLGNIADRNYLVMQHTSGAVILPPFLGPGVLLYFDSPSDPPTIIADCLTRPSSMVLDKKTGKLYVTEVGGKVVALDISSSIQKFGYTEITNISPDQFYLEQNYPNPFNPSTTISYQLPISGNVTLKVYDLLGREVATLVDEYKPVGKYEIEFDATELSTGIYFYKLQAVDPSTGSGQAFIETKKMILLK